MFDGVFRFFNFCQLITIMSVVAVINKIQREQAGCFIGRRVLKSFVIFMVVEMYHAIRIFAFSSVFHV